VTACFASSLCYGYEVTRVLRADPALNETIVAATTGYGQEEDIRRSKQAGFHEHPVIPVDLQALKAEGRCSDQSCAVRDPPRARQYRATVSSKRLRSTGLATYSSTSRKPDCCSASPVSVRTATGIGANTGSCSCSDRNVQPFIPGIIRSSRIRLGAGWLRR
jgi:hypothetical protein